MQAPVVLAVASSRDGRAALVRTLDGLPFPISAPEAPEAVLAALSRLPRGVVVLDFSGPAGALGFLQEAEALRPDVPVLGVVPPYERAFPVRGGRPVDASPALEPDGDLHRVVREYVEPDRLRRSGAVAYGRHVELAKERLRAHRMHAAEAHARQALAIDPSRPEAYNLLGVVQEATVHRTEAVMFYHMALEADPTYELAQRNLATASKPVTQRGPAEFE